MSTHWVSSDLQAWLAEHAQSLHESNVHADKLLPLLTSSGLVQVGVPTQWGGIGGDAHHAVEAIAEVAEQSLTAAFVLWAQRAFIEYLCVTDNPAARDFWLPQILAGRTAGATGLSNAMKFLSALEALQVQEDAPASDALRRISGRLPWVTNLRQPHFVVAAAVQRHDASRPPLVVEHWTARPQALSARPIWICWACALATPPPSNCSKWPCPRMGCWPRMARRFSSARGPCF